MNIDRKKSRLRRWIGVVIALFVLGVWIPVGSQTVEFVRGDVDAGGAINVADVIIILGYMAGNTMLDCLDAADLNDDGEINVVDPIFGLALLFIPGSNTPLAPFPGCGLDPTADVLDCVSFATCP